MTSQEILEAYINFYKQRGHTLIPNVSLVPEGDSTLLFVNSGMFPLVPYLSGEPHPDGTRLVNVQRALRFEDLDDVGDNRHTTAFHMIGNWSLGDYFKEEQLPWVYEFFIERLGLDPQRLYGTVFEGDNNAPRDETSIQLLKDIFAKYGIDAKLGERIFAYDKKENWWQRGDAIGELGGPDSEIFYYIGGDGTGLGKNLVDHEDDFIEIGNSVFMQYQRTESGWQELSQANVDFGGGLERLAMVVQGKDDIFQTDNFWPVIEKVQSLTGYSYEESNEVRAHMRQLADHMRAATFLAMDGVLPSNKDQGYVLRRYLRRIVRVGKQLGLDQDISVRLVPIVVKTFAWMYPQLETQHDDIIETFKQEEEKFAKTLGRAEKQVEKELETLSLDDTDVIANKAFDLYQSLGYPAEMFLEDLHQKGLNMSEEDFMTAFNQAFESHQAESRKGAEQKFKGGLADHSDQVVKYHTGTHLLHWALRQVLGDHVIQRGSNITGERLRFDFSHDGKLSDEEVARVEALINEKIVAALPVQFEIMPKDEAEKTGAIHAFGETYGDQVKVYYIGNSLEEAVSKEFCGGPHVENTREIGEMELYKQESVGKGVRRIYARNRE